MMILVYLILAVGVAYVLYRYFPNATKRWFRRIRTSQKTVFGLLFLATMTVLLISGVWYLSLAGFGMAILAVLFVFIEEPHEVLT